MRGALVLAAGLAAALLGWGAQAQQASMTFFVTSVGPGKGADLGGLEGADPHCRQLAQAVGAGNRTWRAYLSTQAAGGAAAVNARDRIGTGSLAERQRCRDRQSVDELHGANNLTKQTALNEKGEIVNGRGDTPNRHDILTGSRRTARAFPAADGPHLRQLDQERGRGGHGRPSRPHGPARRRRREVLELLASAARLRPRRAAGRRAAPGCSTASRRTRDLRGNAMADKTPIKSKKVARKPTASRAAAKPALLAGGNPQIAKGYGDAPVQAYIAAMPGWKRDVGRRLDALIVRTVPSVAKAVKFGTCPSMASRASERRKAGSSAFIASRVT